MSQTERLPSLNALRAFEAVTRHLSFSAAAVELHVTKAAVAQQIRLLEAEIGAPLVQRSGRGLTLTEAGHAGLSDLREGFDLLYRGARRMHEASGHSRLVINSSPSFAATWLVGRIGDFKKKHPDMDVLLDATTEVRDLWRDNVDGVIRWSQGSFPDLHATHLFDEDLFPVCAPSLMAGKHALRTPKDLAHHTLLHLEWNPNYDTWPTWETWLAAAGVKTVETGRGVWFNQMSIALQAAVQGQGVALMTKALAASEMEAGRLVAPFNINVHTPYGYYFVCRKDRIKIPKIVAFREWLIGAAAADSGKR